MSNKSCFIHLCRVTLNLARFIGSYMSSHPVLVRYDPMWRRRSCNKRFIETQAMMFDLNISQSLGFKEIPKHVQCPDT